MRISIYGLGYVGCVSMGCLSKNGHTVMGVDVAQSKVDAINRGESPIVEIGLSELLKEQHETGKIKATSDSDQALQDTEVSFICVGTPSTSEGHLNLNAIYNVSKEIGAALSKKQKFHVVVIRSTVLPGTNEKVGEIIQEHSGKQRNEDFAVVSNPEFLREGSAINDYYNPPFTLVGSDSERAINVMKSVYDKLQAPLITCEIKIAEIMKYINNAFHAQKVVFANEVGNICKKLGIDSHRVMEIFCMEKKLNISPYYLKPGFAYGGSCLPKDLKALKTIAHDHYLNCPLIDSIEQSNEYQKQIVYKQIMDLKIDRIGFLGISFKADTDDLRNSPVLDIIERLLGKGLDVKIYDKNVHFSQLMGANKDFILNKIPYISKFITDDYMQVIKKSELIVVVNNSAEFKNILSAAPEETIIYDLVNIHFKGRTDRKSYIGVSW